MNQSYICTLKTTTNKRNGILFSNSYPSSFLFLSNDQTTIGSFGPLVLVHCLIKSSWKIDNKWQVQIHINL